MNPSTDRLFGSDQQLDLKVINELSKMEDRKPLERIVENQLALKRGLLNTAALVSSGVCARILLGPFERIKLLLQTQMVWRTNELTSLKEKRLFPMMNEVKLTQGLFGLWRGVLAGCIKTFPNSISRLLIYDNILSSLTGYQSDRASTLNKAWKACIAAFSSSLVANAFGYPLERIRVVMALQMMHIDTLEKPSGLFKSIMNQMRLDEFKSLYRGFWLNSLLTIPSMMVTMVTYHMICDPRRYTEATDLRIRYFYSSIVAVSASLLLTYPLDTILRLVQADSTQVVPTQVFTSTKDCIRKVWNQEGFFGFYRGYSLGAFVKPLMVLTELGIFNTVRVAFSGGKY